MESVDMLGSRTLTIHEAQGLTSEGTVIVRTMTKQKVDESLLRSVVAITRHTAVCVYDVDDDEDAVGRFIKRTTTAIDKKIKDGNAKKAIRNRDRHLAEGSHDRMVERPDPEWMNGRTDEERKFNETFMR
ncbi:hypothetical protein EVAR_98773_1 [Eumeta japonica]|uniref:(+)RNA virus helicase C-terminal domain-containing protein n=1 Tax=Eumeta variegata TaxID=151549 RepID=A0A4C1YS00_EUMVA|nr:hypothetical protein EVAR_98773_1 [Eumeta japonica]